MSDPSPKAPPLKALSEEVASQKSLLRVVFCGSVDDGKSTLIGRLLADTGNIADDQLAALEADSRRFGTTGGALDYALLVDGLEAEREQAITIDVAYRYASSQKRAYIIADTPGHVQYTRNMATGASQADVAVVLIDARLGLLQQTRRHVTIAALFGVREVVAAINKMDLIGFSQEDYAKIAAQFYDLATRLGIGKVATIPLVARDGDGVARASTRMPWYRGPTLLEHLDAITQSDRQQTSQFRLPVQLVNRPNADFRGYSGTIAAGSARVGDTVVVLPSGQTSAIATINSVDGERASAVAGDAVTLVLKDAIDVSRGDVIAATPDRPMVADQFAADIVWMSEEPMLPGRQYLLKCGTRSVTGFVSSLRHVLDIDQLGKHAARRLTFNEIGHCHVALSGPVVMEPYDVTRSLGSFIIIDKTTRFTVGAGMIRHPLRRATNVHQQRVDIDRAARAAALGQVPRCIWFTGLSGAGKSTIANAFEKRLHAEGRHTYLLDGDNVRLGLNRDLGFTNADRVENIRRVGEVAKLMVDAGLIVLVAFISPFRAERQMVRDLFGPGEFIEVFVDTPLDVCEARDVKGLYAKARAGDLKNFTGIDSPYEAPLAPEVRLAAGGDMPIEALLTQIADALTIKPAST